MKCSFVGIDQGDAYLDAVSHAEGSAALSSSHRVRRSVVVEAFAVGQIADMDKAIHRVFLAAAEDAELLDAGDYRPKCFLGFRRK